MASAYFNSVDDYLIATTNLLTSSTSFTAMGWIKFASTTAADRQIFQVKSTPANDPVVKIMRDSTGALFATCDNGATWIGGWTPTFTTWMCWFVKADGGTATAGYRMDGGGSWTTDTASTSTFTVGKIVIGDEGSQTPDMYGRYFRMWDGALSESELSAEFTSATPVRTSGLLRDMRLAGAAAAVTDSYNGYDMSLTGTLGADGDDPTSPGGLNKYLKFLLQSAAVGQTVQGVVFESPTASPETTDIVGAKVGEFTGASVAAGTGDDTGKGVVLVDVADFGGGALAADEVVIALVRNATDGTGLESGVIVEI